MVNLTMSEAQHVLMAMEEMYHQSNDSMPEADEALEIVRKALENAMDEEMTQDATSENEVATQGGSDEVRNEPDAVEPAPASV